MDSKPEERKLDKVFGIIKEFRIEPFLFLFIFGVSIKDVTIQTIIMERACLLNLNESASICAHLDEHEDVKAEVQKIALYYRVTLILIAAVPGAISATFLSPWSDKYGRKFPIILAVFGVLLEGIGSMIVANASSAPLYLFLLTHIPSGIFGGYLVAISSTYTYLSDVTTRESRSIRFAILEFVTVVASPLGTEVGGQVYKYSGGIAVLIVGLASQGACFLWAMFGVKEVRGLNEKKNIKEMLKHVFELDNLKETFRTCTAKRPGTLRAQIWLIMLALSLSILCFIGTMSIGYLFTIAMYNWSNPTYSTVSAISRLFQGICVLIAVPIFTKVLNIPDSSIAVIGALSSTAECVMRIAAYQEWMYYYGCVVGLLAGTLGVGARSRLSKMVTKDELSKVFSLLALCEASTPAFSMVIFGPLYAATLKSFPGASYLLQSFFMVIIAGILIWVKKQGPPPTSHEVGEGGYRMESFVETLTDVPSKQQDG